jgi:hypothetical protein
MYANPVSHGAVAFTAEELIRVSAAELEHDDERAALARVRLDELTARGLLSPAHDGSQTPYDDRHRLQLVAIARHLGQGASLDALERRHEVTIAAARACTAADPDALSRAVAIGIAQGRPELAIFEAMSCVMRGEWHRALAVLDNVDPDRLPTPSADANHWLFGYHHARFEALLHVDLAGAATVLGEQLVPLAIRDDSPRAWQMIECCRAGLAYHRGDASCAAPLKQLREAPDLGRFAAAEVDYMLGILALREGDRITATQRLSSAHRLAPRTWIGAAVKQLASATQVRRG